MADEDEILEVIVPVEDYEVTKTNVLKQIWNQITAGVGVWGTIRPIIAITFSLIPFLYLGQHVLCCSIEGSGIGKDRVAAVLR